MSWQRATQKCFNKINHDTYISYMWVTIYIYIILVGWVSLCAAGFFQRVHHCSSPKGSQSSSISLGLYLQLWPQIPSDPRAARHPKKIQTAQTADSRRAEEGALPVGKRSLLGQALPVLINLRQYTQYTKQMPGQAKTNQRCSLWALLHGDLPGGKQLSRRRLRRPGQSSAPPFLWSSPDWTACPRRSSPSPHRLVLLTYDSIISLATFTASLFPIGYSCYSYPFWIGRSYPFAGISLISSFQYVNIEQKHTKTFIAQTVPDCPHVKKMPSLLIPALMVPRESQPCRVCGGWVEPQLQPQTPPTSAGIRIHTSV